MNMVEIITMVRVYLAEGRSDLSKVEKMVTRRKADVRGYTVFRGIAGDR